MCVCVFPFFLGLQLIIIYCRNFSCCFISWTPKLLSVYLHLIISNVFSYSFNISWIIQHSSTIAQQKNKLSSIKKKCVICIISLPKYYWSCITFTESTIDTTSPLLTPLIVTSSIELFMMSNWLKVKTFKLPGACIQIEILLELIICPLFLNKGPKKKKNTEK